MAAPVVRHRLGLPHPVVSVLSWQAPVALAVARPRTPVRDAGLYALQMWAYAAHYQMPGDHPDRLLRRLRVRYPIVADEALGLGEVPSVRLQRSLGRPGRVLPHDVALTCVHWAWYIVPHATVGYILLRRRSRYPRSAAQMAGVFDLGLVVYWSLPTAPPWWAGQNGDMPHVRRIMVEVGEHVWGRYWKPLYDLIGGNPFAAMPSLHFATSVMAAHLLAGVGRGPGALGWAYVVSLGFGLIYLGEHYVVDLLGGLALAEAVRRLVPAAEPVVLAVQRRLQRLETGWAVWHYA